MRNYIVLDTEATPTARVKECKPELSRVYDLGYCIIDGKTGETLAKRSFVITDTFYNARLMKSAYYAEKLPQYREGLKSGEWVAVSLLEAFEQVAKDCAEYGVKRFYAFNCAYDKKVLDATIADYSNGFIVSFIPKGCEWRDIMRFACDSVCDTKKYANWCLNHNYLTLKGCAKMTAEVVYQYISKNEDFIERHTALSDAEIETEILQACLKRKAKRSVKPGRSFKKLSR